MATFPAAPEEVIVDIFVNSKWTNITSDVRLRDQVTVSSGYRSVTRQPTPTPAECEFTINNRSGDYSPKNPLGKYFGSIGQNTPLRVSSRVARDAFNRTVSNGLGTADMGGAWTLLGTASRFSTSTAGGGAASISWTTADGALAAYLAGYVFRNVDVACTFTLPASNITGGNMAVELLLNGISVTDVFEARLVVTTAEVMLLDIVHIGTGSTIAAQVTITDFAYTGQALRMRAQLSGQTLRAKVWPAASGEPFGWHTVGSYVEGATEGTVFADRGKGWVGLRAEVVPGNTNVPCVIKASDFEARINQFHGEAVNWPTEWDVSGRDIIGRVEAAGIRRRLAQGQTTLPSTYKRANTNLTPPSLLYYPCEDGSESTTIASGFVDAAPMQIITDVGSPQLASSSDFAPGSAPIGKPNKSRWISPRVAAAATGKIQFLFLLSIPDSGEVDTAAFAQIQCTGTVGFVDCYYDAVTPSTGGLHLKFYDQQRALVHTSGSLIPGGGETLNGTPYQVSIELTQSGSDIGYVVALMSPGGSGWAPFGTVTGYTIGAPTGFHISPYAQVASSAVGHTQLRNDIISIFSASNALNAYNGEGVRTRLNRLCAENDGVSIERTRSTINDQTLLGKQKQNTFLALLDEAIKSDMGFLLESPDTSGFVAVTMRSIYNREAFVTLDYPSGQVQPPFQVVPDDQLLINDFTAARIDGSSYRATQTTGPAALTSPTSGRGVGRYNDSEDYSLSSDTYLPDMAAWVVHVGTVDDARYPSINADLTALARTNRQLYLDLLGIWAGDRLEITNAKPKIIQGTVSQIVYGSRRRFGGKHHTLELTCASALPYTVAEAALDTGDTNPWIGRYDTDGSTVASLANAGATSLSVATPSGPLWATAADDFPMYLDVGGVQVRTTACSGASSPQTFTVDALPVARAANLSVSVWRLPVLAQ